MSIDESAVAEFLARAAEERAHSFRTSLSHTRKYVACDVARALDHMLDMMRLGDRHALLDLLFVLLAPPAAAELEKLVPSAEEGHPSTFLRRASACVSVCQSANRDHKLQRVHSMRELFAPTRMAALARFKFGEVEAVTECGAWLRAAWPLPLFFPESAFLPPQMPECALHAWLGPYLRVLPSRESWPRGFAWIELGQSPTTVAEAVATAVPRLLPDLAALIGEYAAVPDPPADLVALTATLRSANGLGARAARLVAEYAHPGSRTDWTPLLRARETPGPDRTSRIRFGNRAFVTAESTKFSSRLCDWTVDMPLEFVRAHATARLREESPHLFPPASEPACDVRMKRRRGDSRNR